MLATNHLTVTYGQKTVLDDISLSLEGPMLMGILGPNGAGKSTLLKALIGLVPCSGRIYLDNQETNLLGKVAYVEQKSHIDYHFPITVRECVSLGRYKAVGLFKHLTSSDWQKVDQVIEQLQLTAFQDHPISQLSGGQFQRMLVARCLVQEADIIFLDEPFVGIDATSEQLIVDLLWDLRKAGKTILVVHHDLNKVSHYFDQVMLLNQKLIAYGSTPEIFTKSNLKKTYGSAIFLDEEVAQ